MLSEMIQTIIGSNLEYAGFIALIAFLLFIVWFGLDIGVGMLIIVPLILILASAGLLPAWFVIPVVLVLIVFIFLAFKSATER